MVNDDSLTMIRRQTTRDAIEVMRRRLLDLSNRNKFINYRHRDSARQLRFVSTTLTDLYNALTGMVSLDVRALMPPASLDEEAEFSDELELARLTDSDYLDAVAGADDGAIDAAEKSLRRRVAERLGITLEDLSRPEVARRQGINPDFDLVIDEEQSRRDVQTLLYPEALERKLSAIRDEARSTVEELGINTLYVAFGFLEWYESDSSAKALFSPLLLVPAEIERTSAHGRYRYSLRGIDEEIESNTTLAERLKADFGILLKAFDEESGLEAYLQQIATAIRGKSRWRVRPFATLGLFNFSRLAMYRDLDQDRRADAHQLDANALVVDLLGGVEGDQALNVDRATVEPEHPWSPDAPTLITDADASQYSAIIEALTTRSLVIEGPPGTGKSQTITNLIAALLAKGKRVLFVAEKLAALEVVKSRLDRAGIGAFALELHSTKTRKSDFYATLKKRLDPRGNRHENSEDAGRLAYSQARKIDAYSNALHEEVGRLGATLWEIVWRQQRLRGGLSSDAVARLEDISIPGCLEIDREALAELKTHLIAYADRRASYAEQYGALELHPLGAIQLESATSADLTSIRAELEEALSILQSQGREIGYTFPEVSSEEWTIGELSALETFLETLLTLPYIPDRLSARTATAVKDRAQAAVTIVKLLEAESVLATFSDSAQRCVTSSPADLEQVASRLRGLQIGPDRDAASLAGEIADLRLKATTSRQVEELAEQLRAQCLPFLPDNLEAVTQIRAFAEAAAQAGTAARRAATWSVMETAGLEVVERASREAQLLQRQRDALREQFDMSLGQDVEALRQASADLRSARWYEVLSSRVRAAWQRYRSIRIGQPSRARRAAADELSALADFLDAREAFARRPEYARIFSSFDGIDTNVANVLAAAQLGERLRDLAGTFGISAAVFDAALDSNISANLELLASVHENAALKQFTADGFPTASTVRELRGVIDERADELRQLHESLMRLHLGELPAQRLLRLAEAGQRRETLLSLRDIDPSFAALVSPVPTGAELDHALAAVGLAERIDGMPKPIPQYVASSDMRELAAWFANSKFRASSGAFRESIARLGQIAKLDATILFRGACSEASHDAALSAVAAVLANLPALPDWILYNSLHHRLHDRGLSRFLELALEIAGAPIDLSFEYAMLRTIVKDAMADEDVLRHSGLELADIRRRFAEADARFLADARHKLAADLRKRSIPAGSRVGKRGLWTDRALIDNEVEKSRKQIPIRDLMRRAGKAVQAAMPCFMMSPLSVAQYMEPSALSFDVIIIDEASQMRPEDALGAVSRGAQLVVVGDPKQLPPTSFFDRADATDEVPDEDTIETESILDLALQQYGSPKRLLWHYRSRHDSLIAFSNREFYESSLVVFPSPLHGEQYGVRLRKVVGRYTASLNPIEAEAVAERAIRLMESEPDRSIAIVAINQPQRDLIRLEMERRLSTNLAAQKYVARWDEQMEPFIIKNLESIQGDERDVVLISTVYGPDGAGNVHQRFGPINSLTGWRRLNVLFTRAKYRVELFTSMDPGDIVVDTKTSRGARALRGYLEFAGTGRLEAGKLTGRPPDSDFEVAVASMLSDAGYECVPQVGVEHFFIDIAVVDRLDSSRFVLGIECDGQMYHSTKAARDRDRLRDEILSRLGWRLHRIWSTDWFADPAREMRRLLQVLRDIEGSQIPRHKPVDVVGTETLPLFDAEPDDSRDELDSSPARGTTFTVGKHIVEDGRQSVEIIGAIEALLKPGQRVEREWLLGAVCQRLGTELTKQTRSAINKTISSEVSIGRLRVDKSWTTVARA